MSARIFHMTALCDKCGEPTLIGDLDRLDDDEGRWCLCCRIESAQRAYWREPEINPDR
jgi:CRISPR/Cas system-associated protein Cas10 (large subunit of type III CRISPR-Cas system)